MPQYRKKPIVIEARRVPDDPYDIDTFLDTSIALARWCGGTPYLMVSEAERAYEGCEVVGPHIAIKTLEGTTVAVPGDYIIKGAQGEFYPCKPDIFHDTYEEVN